MINIGFVGYGSMGSMLVKGLIEYSKVEERSIIITRKNKDKLSLITKEWKNINITDEIAQVVTNAKYIFLCIKPIDYLEIMNKMKPYITKEHHVISITSALMLEDLEQILDCKITKIMPTVISEISEGLTLICHNHKVTKEDANSFEQLLSGFTRLTFIQDEDFGFASEFTSCGPGFYAEILKEFVEAGARYSDRISKEVITHMVLQTVRGTINYITDKNLEFDDVIKRVATKGGITQEGVSVMESKLPGVFDEVFDKTMEKRKVVDEGLQKQFLEFES